MNTDWNQTLPTASRQYRYLMHHEKFMIVCIINATFKHSFWAVSWWYGYIGGKRPWKRQLLYMYIFLKDHQWSLYVCLFFQVLTDLGFLFNLTLPYNSFYSCKNKMYFKTIVRSWYIHQKFLVNWNLTRDRWKNLSPSKKCLHEANVSKFQEFPRICIT